MYRWKERATGRKSTVSSDSCLEIGHAVVCGLSSSILIAVNLQFQGRFVPISLRSVLRIVTTDVMAIVMQLLPHGGGFSVHKTAQRM